MRNTICAALTAITLVLCAALAGCGNASKTSTPTHAIAATGTTCSEESSDERIKMHRHTVRDATSRLRHHHR